MAAAFVGYHTGNQSTTSGTTITFDLTGPVIAGRLLVLWVGMDNTSSTAPTVSTITKPVEETAVWARIAQHNSSTATSGAGVRGEMWAILTTVPWSAATYTVTLSGTVTSKAIIAAEFSGVTATLRSTAGTGTSTSGVPTATTSGTAPVAGDLVLGGGTFESNVNPTLDADTTGGVAWIGTQTIANTGTALTSVSACISYKIPTSDGHQTYNSTGSGDSGSAVVALVTSGVSNIQVGQFSVEALEQGTPVVRAGQVAVEALGQGSPVIRAGQVVVEVLVPPPASDSRLAAQSVQVVGQVASESRLAAQSSQVVGWVASESRLAAQSIQVVTVPYVPTGPAWSVWNGTTEVPATVTVWNGTSEIATTTEIAP